jgi:membrane protein implicated in regulation of membrane protease activity
MSNIGFTEVLIIIILAGSFLAIIGLAAFKIVKSRLPDWEKVYWTVALVIFNIIAAVSFIIFHDYFLSRDKRSE